VREGERASECFKAVINGVHEEREIMWEGNDSIKFLERRGGTVAGRGRGWGRGCVPGARRSGSRLVGPSVWSRSWRAGQGRALRLGYSGLGVCDAWGVVGSARRWVRRGGVVGSGRGRGGVARLCRWRRAKGHGASVGFLLAAVAAWRGARGGG
jgi:hypothetical protein